MANPSSELSSIEMDSAHSSNEDINALPLPPPIRGNSDVNYQYDPTRTISYQNVCDNLGQIPSIRMNDNSNRTHKQRTRVDIPQKMSLLERLKLILKICSCCKKGLEADAEVPAPEDQATTPASFPDLRSNMEQQIIDAQPTASGEYTGEEVEYGNVGPMANQYRNGQNSPVQGRGGQYANQECNQELIISPPQEFIESHIENNDDDDNNNNNNAGSGPAYSEIHNAVTSSNPANSNTENRPEQPPISAIQENLSPVGAHLVEIGILKPTALVACMPKMKDAILRRRQATGVDASEVDTGITATTRSNQIPLQR